MRTGHGVRYQRVKYLNDKIYAKKWWLREVVFEFVQRAYCVRVSCARMAVIRYVLRL